MERFRTLSFHGVVFETVDLPLSEEKRIQYDAAVHFWEEFKQQFDTDLKYNVDRIESGSFQGEGGDSVGNQKSLKKSMSTKRRLFWSTQQR